VRSMSRPGDCWDNAVAESFFATLKTELVAEADWLTHELARAAVFEYIEVWCNRQRRHSSLGCPRRSMKRCTRRKQRNSTVHGSGQLQTSSLLTQPPVAA